MRHAAKIETSERLQRVLAILKDGEWHGSFDLMNQTKLVAIGSAISELRANGYEVESRCIGQGRYEYCLGERAEEGDEGANEGRSSLTQNTLAESSPLRAMASMGKGESSARNLKIEANRNKSATDSPAPPYPQGPVGDSTHRADGSGLRPKWDDWSHFSNPRSTGSFGEMEMQEKLF